MSIKEINISNRIIGGENPCFTIAEAGANHDGKIEKAFKLIDSAKQSGADSIKFQTYKASKLTTRNAPKYWEDGIDNETQFDVFNKLDLLKNDEWKEIFEYANKKEIICFSTPFDEESADLLYSFQVPMFKIASADITHIPLIKHIAKKGLPVFLSSGMASMEEIHEAVSSIEDTGNHNIVLLHCITSYPTANQDANLDMIKTLQQNFPSCIIGYSDHTLGTLIPALSVLYGSKIIEKHFTYDTKLSESRDHRLSLDVQGFKEMIENIRVAEISKGFNREIVFDSEKEGIKFARRSIVSLQKITVGTTITKNMIGVKRPGTGIYPKFFDSIIGKKAIRDIGEDQPLEWEDIEKKNI
jgi:N,N'-diacetyllegionaminate synthase